MNFWEIVDAELEYRGMSRKTLSDLAEFNLSNVGKGIKLGSTPSAETAVKIAQVLNVTVEYLVTGKNSNGANMEDDELPLLHKYNKVVKSLESISPKARSAIIKMIMEIGKIQ